MIIFCVRLCGDVLTCLVSNSDCRPFSPVRQLSVHTHLILCVGLQVVETVSVGSSAQLRLLLLTICRTHTHQLVIILLCTDPLFVLWGSVSVGHEVPERNKVVYVNMLYYLLLSYQKLVTQTVPAAPGADLQSSPN